MVNTVSAASSSGISRAAIRPKERSRPARANAITNTAAVTAATVLTGSGARDSRTCDAVLSVTTTAVNSAARTALSWIPDMSIVKGESVMGAGKGPLKDACERPYRHSPGIRPLRNRSTKVWWSARARAP